MAGQLQGMAGHRRKSGGKAAKNHSCLQLALASPQRNPHLPCPLGYRRHSTARQGVLLPPRGDGAADRWRATYGEEPLEANGSTLVELCWVRSTVRVLCFLSVNGCNTVKARALLSLTLVALELSSVHKPSSPLNRCTGPGDFA